jgi:hypothetical protein
VGIRNANDRVLAKGKQLLIFSEPVFEPPEFDPSDWLNSLNMDPRVKPESDGLFFEPSHHHPSSRPD